MRQLILVILACFCASTAAQAASVSDVLCLPYKQKWEAVSHGVNVAAMTNVIDHTDSHCASLLAEARARRSAVERERVAKKPPPKATPLNAPSDEYPRPTAAAAAPAPIVDIDAARATLDQAAVDLKPYESTNREHAPAVGQAVMALARGYAAIGSIDQTRALIHLALQLASLIPDTTVERSEIQAVSIVYDEAAQLAKKTGDSVTARAAVDEEKKVVARMQPVNGVDTMPAVMTGPVAKRYAELGDFSEARAILQSTLAASKNNWATTDPILLSVESMSAYMPISALASAGDLDGALSLADGIANLQVRNSAYYAIAQSLPAIGRCDALSAIANKWRPWAKQVGQGGAVPPVERDIIQMASQCRQATVVRAEITRYAPKLEPDDTHTRAVFAFLAAQAGDGEQAGELLSQLGSFDKPEDSEPQYGCYALPSSTTGDPVGDRMLAARAFEIEGQSATAAQVAQAAFTIAENGNGVSTQITCESLVIDQLVEGQMLDQAKALSPPLADLAKRLPPASNSRSQSLRTAALSLARSGRYKEALEVANMAAADARMDLTVLVAGEAAHRRDFATAGQIAGSIDHSQLGYFHAVELIVEAQAGA
jgi:tetratricopeptide (TPR) repeat protein